MTRTTEMRISTIGQISLLFLTVILLFLPVQEAAAANTLSVHIEKDEWSWTGDTAATFRGSVICQGLSEDDPVTLRLTVEASPAESDPGDIVFTSVNGKRLAVKKQKNEYRLTSSPTATTAFTGSWNIPKEGKFGEVTIRIEAIGPDGICQGEDFFTMKDSTVIVNDDPVPKLPNPGKYIRPLFIAAAIIWMLAVIRVYYYRHRR